MFWRLAGQAVALRNCTRRPAYLSTKEGSFEDDCTRTARSGALQGIRILDLSRILAGPFASMLLGDYGAEVIKVEQPGQGDDTRSWGPPFAPVHDETNDRAVAEAQNNSAYYLGVNRNKYSITIDLKHRRGQQIIADLAAQSDVVLHNFVPGKEKSLGVDYERLSALNPRLIYASISGFGQKGEAAQRPAYDVMVAAMCGLIDITGESDRPPSKPGVALTDVCTGLLAHGAISAALFERERSGQGQRIDMSLYETQFTCLANIAANWLVAQKGSKRMGTAHASIVPYQGFCSADGRWLMFGALNQSQWARLCPVLFSTEQAQEMSCDPRFLNNALRVQHREELVQLLQTAVAQHDRTELLAKLIAADIPCAPVNSIAEAFAEKQAHDLGIVQSIEHPFFGDLAVVRPPASFSRTPASLSLPPPLLGQHTEHILSTVCGYSSDYIRELRQVGCI